MKRNLKIVVTLVIIVLSLLYRREGSELFDKSSRDQVVSQTTEVPTGVKIKSEFIRSIDGDTGWYKINGREYKVRYLLIDTPETVDPNKGVQPWGPEASDRSAGLLTNANEIEVQLDEENLKDNHGRLLAHIFVDGEHLQNILVKEGLAKIYFIENPADEYLPELKKSEQFAKKNKLGIWSKEN